MTLDTIRDKEPFNQLSHRLEAQQTEDTQFVGSEDEGGIDFGKVLGALRRQSWVIFGTTMLCAAMGGIKAATDTPIYQAQFELLAEPVSLESQVISATTPESSSREELVGVIPNEAKLKVLKSPRVLEPLIKDLQSEYPELSYDSLTNNLALSIDQENNIIQVNYTHEESEQVRAVLENLKDAYLEFSLEVRQSELNKGLQFVEKQLPKLRSRVDQIQSRLQRLRQENNFIDPTMEAEQLSDQIGGFVEQRLEVQAQLDEAQLLAQDLQKELSQQSIEKASASALTTPRYEALLEELQNIDTEIAKESAIFSENSPKIQTLRQQRQQLVPLLRAEAQRAQRQVESQIRELQARDRALGQTIVRLNRQSKELSESTRRYTDLQRELEIASKNLNQFLTKREALGIDLAQSESPWEVLTPPDDPIASSASVTKNLVLGSALGLLLGIGAALSLDRLRDLLHSTKDIKTVTRLPLLGSIPYDKVLVMRDDTTVKSLQPASSKLLNQSQSSLEQKTSVAVESFRSIYTNLRLLNPDVPIQSIVVSSSIPGEGKSTISTHLAEAAAAMGRRVLLVDADLRKTKPNYPAERTNPLGLTNLIDQENLEVEQVIQQSSVEDNLFFLSSGHLPPDPSKLLASEKMQRLMTHLQSQFEFVIYDATILSGFTDAYLLAPATDGLVLVTGMGKLKQSMLEETMQKLKVSRTPVLGIVVNGDKNMNIYQYNNEE